MASRGQRKVNYRTLNSMGLPEKDQESVGNNSELDEKGDVVACTALDSMAEELDKLHIREGALRMQLEMEKKRRAIAEIQLELSRYECEEPGRAYRPPPESRGQTSPPPMARLEKSHHDQRESTPLHPTLEKSHQQEVHPSVSSYAGLASPGQAAIHPSVSAYTGYHRTDLNPQIYLRGKQNRTGTVSYESILDYIPKRSRSNEDEFEISDGVVIKMKSRNKLGVENVTPSQWIVASCNILAEIIKNESESLSKDQLATLVCDYMSYSAKIGDLGSRFTWSSVMIYDDEFREIQHKHGFRWGSDSEHLTTVSLKEREKSSSSANSSGVFKGSAKKPERKYYCSKYNEGSVCAYGEECKFLHACENCRRAHPKTKCPALGSKGTHE